MNSIYGYVPSLYNKIFIVIIPPHDRNRSNNIVNVLPFYIDVHVRCRFVCEQIIYLLFNEDTMKIMFIFNIGFDGIILFVLWMLKEYKVKSMGSYEWDLIEEEKIHTHTNK